MGAGGASAILGGVGRSGTFGAGSAGGPTGRAGLPRGAFSSGLSGAKSTKSGSPRLTYAAVPNLLKEISETSSAR